MSAVIVACLFSSVESFLPTRSPECRAIRARAHVLMSTTDEPKSDKERLVDLDTMQPIIPLAATIAALTAESESAHAIGPKNMKMAAERDDFSKSMALPDEAYTDLGGMRSCKILNGMWQVSGAHGYNPEAAKVVAEMAHSVDTGFQTFDFG